MKYLKCNRVKNILKNLLTDQSDKRDVVVNQPQQINVSVNIDYEELAKQMARALNIANIENEQRIKKNENDELELQKEHWENVMGQRKCFSSKKIKKVCNWFGNKFRGFLSIITFKASDTTSAIYHFRQISSTVLLSAYQFVMWISILCSLYFMLINERTRDLAPIVFGVDFIVFIFERIINMLRIELEKSTDRTYIREAFDSIVAFSGMFFGLIAAVFGGLSLALQIANKLPS